MKKIVFLITIVFSTIGYSQSENLQTKLDSIIKEADLLYNYEKAAWVSTDLIMSLERLKNDFGGYIIYHSKDTIYCSIIDKTQKNRIVKYSFNSSNIDAPFNSNFYPSNLTEKEKKLLSIRNIIIDQLSNSKYEIEFPEGFNPNLILVQEGSEYKLYIIMGTGEPGVIPFGNDYLFFTDSDGNIKTWKKFHSRLIPIQSKMTTGEIVTSATHSHLRTTPYITATDICTFRLYSPFTEITEFKVYSPVLGIYMKYNIENNTIEVIE
ncbi:MAG TPA: hypothetical protein DCX41_06280 [Aequorivita sp.]|nr:hypothetical protein [Aequorivita sp.]MBF30021.1 hypothetical protein [Aequorivita sp.]HAV54521.1 hypothetical protein [Aequorivita sp.]HBL80101.1 hypothetical protein [Aequorivita sp.]|tara:strand:+ start:217188 stop:217982 length:795 start_codon:yes stop_codon:yes gene_type:complete